ncbi:MAG: VOC family protein [Ignavibacteriae bacterium]|nr:MAG: VOC family protein [Ignavibacteriota bacterium]
MTLPKNTRIKNYSLKVKNLDEMSEFYEHMLGLNISAQTGNEISFSVNGKENHLLKLTGDKDAAYNSEHHPGLYHIALIFPDRESLAKEFLHLFNKGLKFRGFSDHLVSEAIYLEDPEGNGIELYVDKPRNEWKWRMGEVEMSTLPLDLTVLTDTIKDRNEEFTGTDPRMEIGHIHLQVSNLDKAKKFYHEILGMDITSSSYNGALFFSAGGYHHHIGANIWHSKNSPPLPDNSTGLKEFTINIPGKNVIDEIIAGADKHGLVIDKEKNVIRDFDNNKIILSL